MVSSFLLCEGPVKTQKMASTGPPRLAKYNVRWGNKSNNSSINVSDIMATYKKKVRAVLGKNKYLARALEAAKQKISELEKASSRQQKVYNLALPQIKTWLEMGKEHARNMYQYQSRAVNLLLEIMSPGVDFTLARVSDDDDDDGNNRRPSLHPPEKQWEDHYAGFTVIPEDDEDVSASRRTLLDFITLDPETLLRAAGITPRKSRGARSSGRVGVLNGPPILDAVNGVSNRGSILNKRSSLPAADHPRDGVSTGEATPRKSRGSKSSSGRVSFLDPPCSSSRNPHALTLEVEGMPRKSRGSKSSSGCVSFLDPPSSPSGNPQESTLEAVNANGIRGSSLDRISSLSAAGLYRCDLSADDSLKSTGCYGRRSRRTDIGTGFLDYAFFEPPDLTSAVRQGSKSGEKIVTGGAQNYIPEVADAPRQKTSFGKPPTSTSSADIEKASCASFSPIKVLEAVDEPKRDGLVSSAELAVANVAEASWGARQRSPQSTSHRASRTLCRRSIPEPAEDTTDYFLRAIVNIRHARRTEIIPRVFDASSLESPSLIAAAPEIPDLVSVEKDTEKEHQASFVRSEENNNELANATGLGCVGPAAAPSVNAKALTGVDRGSSRRTKRQTGKTSSRRTARRETVEDGATSSVSSSATGEERVTRSASGRPIRSATLGVNYKEPSTGKKLRRP